MRPALDLMNLAMPAWVWGQEEPWDGHWALHPMWWPFATAAAILVLLVLFGWALLNLAPLILGIVGAVLGIRWLMRAPDSSRPDPAVSVLRERYARGEIGKEEFDAKMKDLGGKP